MTDDSHWEYKQYSGSGLYQGLVGWLLFHTEYLKMADNNSYTLHIEGTDLFKSN